MPLWSASKKKILNKGSLGQSTIDWLCTLNLVTSWSVLLSVIICAKSSASVTPVKLVPSRTSRSGFLSCNLPTKSKRKNPYLETSPRIRLEFFACCWRGDSSWLWCYFGSRIWGWWNNSRRNSRIHDLLVSDTHGRRPALPIGGNEKKLKTLPDTITDEFSSVLGDGFHGMFRIKVPMQHSVQKVLLVGLREASGIKNGMRLCAKNWKKLGFLTLTLKWGIIILLIFWQKWLQATSKWTILACSCFVWVHWWCWEHEDKEATFQVDGTKYFRWDPKRILLQPSW